MMQKIITKFNIVMSCVILAILVVMFVGATIAYFSDHVETAATFTAGNVKIALSEAAVKKDDKGNLVADTQQPRIFGAQEQTVINDYGKIYPGQTVCKDPTVTNTGDEAEWIAA